MVQPPSAKGRLEEYLVSTWSHRKRWLIRTGLVLFQLSLLVISTLITKTAGTTLLTIVILAFAFPPMFNAVLQGLATRGIRVIGVTIVLALQFLIIAGTDTSGLAQPYWYEWFLGIAAPLAGIALIVVPEPASGTDVLGLANRKFMKWFVLILVLCALLATILFLVVKPLITI